MADFKQFKTAIVLFMSVLIFFGAIPINVFAEKKVIETPKEKQFIYFEGEKIPLDDKRIINSIKVTQKNLLLRNSTPHISDISSLSGEFNQNGNVSMGSTLLSPIRYAVTIDDVEYEAYCADPSLRGPQISGAVYSLSGEGKESLKNILKNGYPTNSEWSTIANSEDDRMWWAYVTRVAVAMANNPTKTFTGNAVALEQGKKLSAGEIVADNTAYPGITVNSKQNDEDLGREIYDAVAKSIDFSVGFNRKTNNIYNPFRFEWDSDTPVGAKLVVDGTLVATAPTNPDKIFGDDITSFHIEMPNESEFHDKTAKVNLVGIHNQFADKVWLMQNPNDKNGWQDIVFYIPEMLASATFSFGQEIVPGKGRLKILKQNSSNKGLRGAEFEITGVNGFSKKITSPANGIIEINGLDFGEYTITETKAPTGHEIANPANVTVTVSEETPTIERIFVNETIPTTTPTPTGVKIQKIDALTRENIPGALIRLRGISANVVVTGGTTPSTGDTHWTLNNTGINLSQVLTNGATITSGDVTSTVSDGVWSLEGLPYGAYIVEEERAPANYSLLPQHTSYGFWILPPDITVDVTQVDVIQCPETGEVLETIVDYEIREDENVSSILITFENFPFGEIEVIKHDEITREPIGRGVQFRIEGYFAEGNTNGEPIDTVKTADENGRVVFDNLPAGHYTITEVIAPQGYQLSEDNVQSVSITWGQSATLSFFNKPKTTLDITKVDEFDNSKFLAGAIFELKDPTSGQVLTGTTDSNGKLTLGDGSDGNELYSNKTYILTEIQAPPGYVLDPSQREVVLKNIGENEITIQNTPKANLEVIKVDALDGTKFLSDARFELKDPTTGETWTETTNKDGKLLFGVGNLGNELVGDKTYILTEVQAPNGYILNDKPQEIVLKNIGINTVTITNQPKVSLKILKIDGNTRATLDGAIFELKDPATAEIWEATTNKDGKAVFGVGSLGNELIAGKTYILTETKAPVDYVLNSVPKEIILREIGITTIIVENYHNPSLTIVKRDKNNGQSRLEGAVFDVTYENGETVAGSPFTTNSNGEIILKEVLFDGNEERTLIVTEIIPPDGYNLSDPISKRVTVRQGEDNTIIFENTRKPTLEIHKTDAITGQNLSGAEFTIEKLEQPGKGMLTGNPFTTDSNGKITIPYQYSGKYRIIETKASNNYWLDTLEQNRSWIIEVNENEDYTLKVENTLLPTLIITKWNAVTYKPVSLTHFKIEYEVPNSSNVQLVGEFITNQNGQIVIPFTKVGWYKITETRPAPGMSLNSNNSYRVYLSAGDNSYMPIPDVTENNPNLNSQMPLFKDIQVFGGNDFAVNTESQNDFPQDSIIILGNANETFTVSNAVNSRTARSLVQVDVNVAIIGEFSADSSGILIISGLEATEYSVTNADGKTETATLSADGSIARFDFTAASDTTPTPETSEPTESPTSPLPDTGTGSVFDEDIEYVNDPVTVDHVSRNMSVNNGTEYWNTGEGIWNWPLNSIVIKKQDATNGTLLAGASFDLIYTTSGESGTKGTVIGTFTTDHSGIIVITGLEAGNYVVEEVQAPPNYVLTLNNRQNVNLKADGTSIVEVTYSNYPYGSLLITKVDSITHAPLAGAEFLVTDSKGAVVGTSNGEYTTDSAGNILIEKLPPDSYVVAEQRAPNGYVIGASATKTIQVQPDGRIYRLEFTNDPLSKLIIRKIDSFDGSPLQGAKFEVRRVNGEFIGEFSTDQQGLIEIPNILGTFTVTEMEAPSGYAIDASPIRTVEVKSSSPTYVTFYNPREGSLSISKIDNFGNPLSGAEFRITRQNGEFVANHTTGASGMINILNLTSGFYYVEEIKAPNGYVISQTGQSVEVKANSAAHVVFVNLPQPTLTIQKVDETGQPLSGARFVVSEIGGTFSREVVIGAGGSASIVLPLNSPQANYQIVETHAPNGYTITEPSRVITVKAGENITESFVNYKTPSLVINKLDVNGNPLANAEFEIRSLSGELIATAKSNNGGVAAIGTIARGSYEIIETRAPAGYVMTEQSKIIQIAVGTTATITFVNEAIPGLTIEKVDESGNPLSGAEFEVCTLAGELIQRVTTNNSGVANIAQINPGSYTITESKAPSGYVITETSRNIEISAGQSYTERFVNPKLATFVIQKIDGNTNAPLQGVMFEITTLEGEKIRNPQNNSFEFITDNAGMIRLPNLDAGSYVAVETKALDGYTKAEPHTFVVGHDKDYIITIRNYKLSQWNILKVNGDTEKPLQGVVFEVAPYFGDGKIGNKLKNSNDGSFEFTTDASGLIRLGHLDIGTYIATELKAIDGYIKAEPTIFVVDEDAENTTVTIRNYKFPTYNIKKVDGDTDRPLQGVVFEIHKYFQNGSSGEKIRNPQNGLFEFTSNEAGLITLPTLPHGTYVIIETRPLDGYAKADDTVFVVGDNQDTTIIIRNYKLPDFAICKLDGDTQQPLEGVQFKISHALGNGQSGEMLRNPADNGYIWTTDQNGRIHLNGLEPGNYIVTESRPLQGYSTAEPETFTVDGEDTTITIYNHRLADYAIKKIDGDTNTVLAGVEFEIAHYLGEGKNGERLVNPANGTTTFVTDNAGMINLPSVTEGQYVAIETKPLNGYKKAEPTIFIVGDNQDKTITIRNYKLTDFIVRKLDGDTQQPLEGVQFKISHALGNGQSGEMLRNPADNGYIWTTDQNGRIHLNGLEPGNYIVTESRPLQGYSTAEPETFTIGGEDTTITIYNYRLADYAIKKIDGDTNAVLAGVEFEIAHYLGEGKSGERLVNPTNGTTTFVTDNAGMINLPSITEGQYVAIETKPLNGYQKSEPIIFIVGDNQDKTIVIKNYRQSEVTIKKTDGDSDSPLQGVVFEIRAMNGEKIRNPQTQTYEFTTDNAGLIRLPFLPVGAYTAVETKPLNGYKATEPTNFEIKEGENQTILIRNYRQSELTVCKINSITRKPLQGVIFQISRPNGERLVNPKTGLYDFTTDRNGLIYLPTVEDGSYYITETKALDGYIADLEPKLLTIDTSARQREYLLVIENTPASGLIIIKRDAGTRKVLAGVTFEIRTPDGRLVQSQIQDENQPNTEHNSPQLNASNGFTTDNRGRINLNHLSPGVYHVKETKALDGYILDETVHVVTVEPGKQAVLEIENALLAGLRIKKIDSVTKQGIYNVEFMLFDSSGKVVGNFYSDNNGLVEFPQNIVSGRYTIRETRPASGYSPDNMPRTVDFVAGKVTEIVWENVPMGGQLQISKVSGDYNEMNALMPGTPLSGAIFEIYDARTGNLVDRIMSNERGMAVSKPFPLGRYYAQEVEAPAYYKINSQRIEFDVEFDTQIIKVTFPNFSANVGVSITKTGPKEVMQGSNISYDIKNVKNESAIPLSDYFWRDVLQTNAIRADKLVTGTYNFSLRYKVMGKTNKGNEIVIADNLNTTTNNVIELKPAHLGLASDEYLVEFSLHFGQVPAGFAMVESARLFADVLPKSMANLPNGMMIVNKVDVGGKIPGSTEWVISNSTTSSTLYVPPTNQRYPQSGW